MKNAYKLFALLCMGLAAAACVEENFENDQPKYDTTPGNEIVFTATAGVENGMPKTKTEYGNTGTQDGKNVIEINWVEGDKISIVSPQAAGAEVGNYKVVASSQTNDQYDGPHKASELVRLGDAGLQWTSDNEYDFYAVYPAVINNSTSGLSKEGVFTATMPTDQSGTPDPTTNGWVVTPNMNNAFMSAVGNYSRLKEDGTQNDGAINLQFNSMVTALQFEIVTGVIGGNNIQNNYIDISSVSLVASNNKISGDFSYDIARGICIPSDFNGNNRVIMHFDDVDKPLRLYSGNSLDVTFFILPEILASNTLELQVIFTLDGTRTSKSAKISAELSGGKKYIFNDVKLPDFTTIVPPSSWWETISPDVLLSQISLPVASNVFANDEYNVSDPNFQQQQMKIDDLWAMGVRGFEICNQSMVYADKFEILGSVLWSTGPDYETEVLKSNLDEEPVVAAERELSETFSSAIDKLYELLLANESECLVLLCTYMSIDDGYNPYVYVANLFNSLTSFCQRHNITNPSDRFTQIGANTTVGDIKGKIAIIIRPGDDERWLYEISKYNANNTIYAPQTDPLSTLGVTTAENGLTSLIPSKLKSDWWNHVLMISDWGASSYDVWDRRYGSSYARAAEFNDIAVARGLATKKSQYEEYLYGISNTYTTIGTIGWSSYSWGGDQADNNFNNRGGEQNINTAPLVFRYPSPPATGYNFTHQMSNNKNAYIQEWMRVIPNDSKKGITEPIAVARRGSSRSGETLWAYWPESITEKEDAIKSLFNKSVMTVGNSAAADLYINVLTGYYATSSRINSCYPYKKDYTSSSGALQLADMGEGGDFAGLAKDLNTYTYNLLTKKTEDKGGDGLAKEGPWGLVILDHINRSDDSYKLVDLIMMNNFKFPLAVKPSGGQGGGNTNPDPEGGSTGTASVKDYNSVYMDGENAISFE